MNSVRRAVIDVGTNSIKLLVADVAEHEVRPVWEESKQTRLGRGFYETRRLQPDAIDATAKAVAQFSQIARTNEANPIRVIATSAARDAINPEELSSAIETASGLKIEIISGEQEADWVFQGVTSDPALAREPLLLLDVGGGSTEFIVGQGNHIEFRESYPLGTVRLLEKSPPSNPPRKEELARCREWIGEFLEREVRTVLLHGLQELHKLQGVNEGDSADRNVGVTKGGEIGNAGVTREIRLVGTGGTTSILGRMEANLETYDRAKIEATRLSLERVRWHTEQLWSLPLEERKRVVGLPPNRADVILMGVAIYEAIMEKFGFAELRISTRGLRFAAVMAEPKVSR
jgi:exopolyphosphatase/guanosine-5'-triphosphate,3'-diphosphate pyrophosphatase